jgi:putative FmdB family regulatory protein
MPTYEYECPRCPRVFEVKQRITEPALETCDRCGGPIHRLLSAAPFILKGEGWYVTDYPSESRKKAKESKESTSKESTSKESTSKESASKEPASKGDGGSAESKPAASSESKSSTESSSSSPSSASKPAAGS